MNKTQLEAANNCNFLITMLAYNKTLTIREKLYLSYEFMQTKEQQELIEKTLTLNHQ